jgi:hypothetical protein
MYWHARQHGGILLAHHAGVEPADDLAPRVAVAQRRVAPQRCHRGRHVRGQRGWGRRVQARGGALTLAAVRLRQRTLAAAEPLAHVAHGADGHADDPGDLAQRGVGVPRQRLLGAQPAGPRVHRPDPAVPADPEQLPVVLPQCAHGLGGQAHLLRDRAIGPVRETAQDPLGRFTPVRQGQRQSVLNVPRNGQHEALLLGAVEKCGLNRLIAAQPCRVHAVHPVDHPHGRAVHQDRRQIDV